VVNEAAESGPPAIERTEEELARIQLGAREARRTIIIVAAIALGSILFMFLITLVLLALRFL
jgi:hypothetical protein